MQIVSSEAIILRTQDYAERDRLLTFLARTQGKVRGIVKGSRKLTSRGVGNFEAFSHGVMYYSAPSASGLVTIRKCDPLPPYLTLQQDYEAFLFAGYLSELIDLCTIPAGDADGVYRLLLEALEALCAPGSPRRLPLIKLRFELHLLELLGLQPRWDQCAACGGNLPPFESGGGSSEGPATGGGSELAGLRFDAARGGLICPACAPGSGRAPLISPRTRGFLAAWRAGATTAVARPTRSALEELDAAVSVHLAHHLERVPRSRALLPSVADLERFGQGGSAPGENG